MKILIQCKVKACGAISSDLPMTPTSIHTYNLGAAPGEKVKHRFSEPWEDSDLILVVENEKFHVHRLIMRMNSPVFKAMFKSQFREATSSEIPLPEKKGNEVLDFLKHIYYQHIQEPAKITCKFNINLSQIIFTTL